MTPCTGAASAQTWKGAWFQVPGVGLGPGPLSHSWEVVNVNEDEKHMGQMEVTRPSSKQKSTTLRGMNSPLLVPQDPVWTVHFPIYGAQYSGIMQQPHTFPLLLGSHNSAVT